MLLSIAASKGPGTEFKDIDNRNCLVCPTCSGTGLRAGAPIYDLSCSNCKGHGFLVKINDTLFNVDASGKGLVSKRPESVTTSISGGKLKCRVN